MFTRWTKPQGRITVRDLAFPPQLRWFLSLSLAVIFKQGHHDSNLHAQDVKEANTYIIKVHHYHNLTINVDNTTCLCTESSLQAE